jgi:hypothetical protein
MSGGLACKTPAHRRRWVVRARKCNHSAFNGGRRTPSAYSEVWCPACPKRWRTKAAYVATLPDETPQETRA